MIDISRIWRIGVLHQNFKRHTGRCHPKYMNNAENRIYIPHLIFLKEEGFYINQKDYDIQKLQDEVYS